MSYINQYYDFHGERLLVQHFMTKMYTDLSEEESYRFLMTEGHTLEEYQYYDKVLEDIDARTISFLKSKQGFFFLGDFKNGSEANIYSNNFLSTYEALSLISKGVVATRIDYYWDYGFYLSVCRLLSVECCYPDFSPILEFLGGTPSDNQLSNLKGICSLLGVDTSENGLKNCDLMKEYLKRLTSMFGGVSSSEPNENLKSICDLLGVQTTENDLKECELSKYYVKQISNMLRGENA